MNAKPNLTLLKIPYWTLTIFLFLLVPGSAFATLFMTASSVSRDAVAMGFVEWFYIAFVLVFGWLPAFIAAIMCVVNLIRTHNLPDHLRQVTFYLCGWPLINIPIAIAFLIFLLCTAIFTPLWYVWPMLTVIYAYLLFRPYIIAKRKQII